MFEVTGDPVQPHVVHTVHTVDRSVKPFAYSTYVLLRKGAAMLGNIVLQG